MKNTNEKTLKRARRHKKIRSRVFGTADRPRLTVFRSGKHIYAQVIDDTAGKTLAASSDIELKLKVPMQERAKAVGMDVAKKAQAKKVEKVTFDRSGFLYAGRIKALADGAREGGLSF